MTIIMIVATDNNYGIGINNKLPWNSPEDMEFFKKTTLGHSIIMGRKTFESMGSKPLKNRKNYVVTRSGKEYDGVQTISTDEDIQKIIKQYSRKLSRLFVIGGSEIYKLFEPYYKFIIWSKIEGDYETDVKIDKSLLVGDSLTTVLDNKISDKVTIYTICKDSGVV